MRPLLCSFLLLAFLASCKKDNSPNLVGSWCEISYVQGLSGRTYLVPADSASILTLKANGTYKDTVYGSTFSSSGTYGFTRIRSLAGGTTPVPAIQFTMEDPVTHVMYPDPPLFYNRFGDTLDLTMNAEDGGSTRYIRIK